MGACGTGYRISCAVNGKQHLAASIGQPVIQMTSLTPELRAGSSNRMFVFVLPDRLRWTLPE